MIAQNHGRGDKKICPGPGPVRPIPGAAGRRGGRRDPVDWAAAEARAATPDDREMLDQLRVLADMAAASGHTTDQSASAESKSPADTRDWVPETPRRRRTVAS